MNERAETFAGELRTAINRASRENASNTPDFILAQYMEASLSAYEQAVLARDAWYGIHPGPAAARPAPEGVEEGPR